MSKLRTLAAILCLHCLHCLHLFKKKVATLFPQGGNTVAALHDTLYSLLSRLKTPFNSCVGGSSVGTSPNFAQENDDFREGSENPPVNDEYLDYLPENDGASVYPADEFDHEDFDEWWEDHYEEWWDGPVFNFRGTTSWQQEAVDEAIDEEVPGQYPPMPF